MLAEPLSGFRQATARPRRTKVDWAIEVAQLLDTRYAACAKVTLVCDNLKHAHQGSVLRGVFAGRGAGVCQTDRLLLHTETRELAERRRMRAELPDQPMYDGPPHW